MITKPGRQATKMEQMMFRHIYNDPNLIVHHITEDTPYRLQLEVETQRLHMGKMIPVFQRIIK